MRWQDNVRKGHALGEKSTRIGLDNKRLTEGKFTVFEFRVGVSIRFGSRYIFLWTGSVNCTVLTATGHMLRFRDLQVLKGMLYRGAPHAYAYIAFIKRHANQ